MKNVLLLVHDDEGQEARFQAALDVVRAIEGHLTCLDVVLMPNLAGDFYGTSAILLADERERESANRARLEPRLKVEGVPWDWIEMTGQIATCLTDAAGLADLIVVNRQLDFPMPDMRGAAAEILVDSRKPLLAVPQTLRAFDPLGEAMLAWDGSPAATSAMRAAIPLLKLARRVVILEVDDGAAEPSGENAATYLSRHGISAVLESFPTGPARDASEILLSEVRRQHPAYLVMGGFGHGRLREALFGGVTRRMLTESPVPLLLAH